MLAFVRLGRATLLLIAVGCGQSADAAGAAPEPPAMLATTAPAPKPKEPTQQPAPTAASDAPSTPTAKPATDLCKNLDRWTLTKRYALSDCTNAMKAGCEESLGTVLAGVDRSLKTSPERLRAAGGTMADLLGMMGDQVDNAVLKPGNAAIAEIKAYAPTDAEKEVHATLAADYETFIATSKRWSKALHKYRGDMMALADLQGETEKAETQALVHDVRYRSLCRGTAK